MLRAEYSRMLMEVSQAYLEGRHLETNEEHDPARPAPREVPGTIDAGGPRTPQVGYWGFQEAFS